MTELERMADLELAFTRNVVTERSNEEYSRNDTNEMSNASDRVSDMVCTNDDLIHDTRGDYFSDDESVSNLPLKNSFDFNENEEYQFHSDSRCDRARDDIDIISIAGDCESGDTLSSMSGRDCPILYEGPCSSLSVLNNSESDVKASDVSDYEDIISSVDCNVVPEPAKLVPIRSNLWSDRLSKIDTMLMSLTDKTTFDEDLIKDVLSLSRKVHSDLELISWQHCPLREIVQLVLEKLYLVHTQIIKINSTSFEGISETEYTKLMVICMRPEVKCLGCNMSDFVVLYRENRWKLKLVVWIDFMNVLIKRWWFVQDIIDSCKVLVSTSKGVRSSLYQQDAKALDSIEETIFSIVATPVSVTTSNDSGCIVESPISRKSSVANNVIFELEASGPGLNAMVIETNSSNLSQESDGSCCGEDLDLTRDKQIMHKKSITYEDDVLETLIGDFMRDNRSLVAREVNAPWSLESDERRGVPRNLSLVRHRPLNSHEAIFRQNTRNSSRRSIMTSECSTVDTKGSNQKGSYEWRLSRLYDHAIDQARFMFRHEDSTKSYSLKLDYVAPVATAEYEEGSFVNLVLALKRQPDGVIEELLMTTNQDKRNQIFGELIENIYLQCQIPGLKSSSIEKGSIEGGLYSNISHEISQMECVDILEGISSPYALLSIIALLLAVDDTYERLLDHLTPDNRTKKLIEQSITIANNFTLFRRKITDEQYEENLRIRHKKLMGSTKELRL